MLLGLIYSTSISVLMDSLKLNFSFMCYKTNINYFSHGLINIVLFLHYTTGFFFFFLLLIYPASIIYSWTH